MKTEKEKQQREHQERFAEVTVKHSKELKDFGKKRTISVSLKHGSLLSYQSICLSINQSHTELSYSQKLIVEHERYQDLQHTCQRMQQDHEKQLKAEEESRTQALEELTQLYEAKLQEKTQLLAQVSQEEQMVVVK